MVYLHTYRRDSKLRRGLHHQWHHQHHRRPHHFGLDLQQKDYCQEYRLFRHHQSHLKPRQEQLEVVLQLGHFQEQQYYFE